MIIFSVVNNKGGVGKTTSAAAIAYLLSKKSRVLVIDADPQCSCALKFGHVPPMNEGPLGTLLRERFFGDKSHPVTDYIYPAKNTKNVDILFGGNILFSVTDSLVIANSQKSVNLLKEILRDEIAPIDIYDYIIIDTSPALNNFLNTVLCATQYLLIPLSPEADALTGANATLRYLGPVREGLNPDIKIAGIFFSRAVDRSTTLHEIEPVARKQWGDAVLKTKIPYNPAASDRSINEGMPIPMKFPVSKAAKAYEKLLKEVLDHVSA